MIQPKEASKPRNETVFKPVTEKPIDFIADICTATTGNKLSSVQYLIEQCHANVEERDYEKRTPLILASRFASFDVVKYLCEKCHADIHAKDLYGRIPLIYAARYGRLDLVKYFYERGANIKARDNDGYNLVNSASCSGHLNIVKYLVENCNANIEAKTNYGHNSLALAALCGRFDVVKYLVEQCHANVNTADKYGRSPCALAFKNNHIEIFNYLVPMTRHSLRFSNVR